MNATCEHVRRDLSALLDHELEAEIAAAHARHLETCGSCRARRDAVAAVRASLRVGEAEPVPDLTEEIVARVGAARPRRSSLLRTFAIAAAIAALVVAGASLPWTSGPGDVASAGEIVTAIRRAARDLRSYHAVFRISEHRWHPRVPRRDFRTEVWFAAPERFRLEIDDLTAYPGAQQWPENDVTLVASARSVQLREPSHCPVAALPGCTSGAAEIRTLTGRAPFDGRVVVPTDIVLPLDTLAGAGAFAVEGEATIAGRSAYRLRLDVRRAHPLLASLRQGGSWRALHPLDEVTLWVERGTWFPLGFDVRAARSPDRARWAAANGYADRPGDLLLRVRSRSFSAPPRLPAGLFQAARAGVVTSGRFRAGTFPRGWPHPATVAGLPAYRSGRTPRAAIAAYAEGTTWLRVTVQPAGAAPPTADVLAAEEVDLGDGRFAYYRPAGPELRRRVDLFGARFAVRLEGNLARAEMLEVARSTPLSARPVPRLTSMGSGVRIERLAPAQIRTEARFARLPAWLPHGYSPARPGTVLLLTSPDAATVVLHYRAREAEYDGVGIRIGQAPAPVLPPTSGTPTAVGIGDGGRYFAERGELEWIEGTVYRSIRAPSYDLTTLLRIARSLR